MKNDYVAVFSSYSVDTILSDNSEVIAIKDGGPAFFISNVFQMRGIPFKTFSGNPINVEIIIRKNGEYGRITSESITRTIDSRNFGKYTIISTILDEWRLAKYYPGFVCIDVQGYVRDGKQFGKKKISGALNALAGNVFCMKGTAEEMRYLSEKALSRQKQNILVITDNFRPIEIYQNNDLTLVPIDPIKGLPDTVGAGDTFFAHFIANMYEGMTERIAALEAARQTKYFLVTKLTVSNNAN